LLRNVGSVVSTSVSGTFVRRKLQGLFKDTAYAVPVQNDIVFKKTRDLDMAGRRARRRGAMAVLCLALLILYFK
jgi:hypothetical protein